MATSELATSVLENGTTGESANGFSDVDTMGDPLGDLGLDLQTETEAIFKSGDDEAEFTEIESNRGTGSPEKQASAKATILDWISNPRVGEPLNIDFETIPDFDRLPLFELPPLPEMPPVDTAETLLRVDELLSQTVPEIEAWLARHNPPPEWIEAVESAEKASKKPRKGLLEAIESHRKRIDGIASAESKRIKDLSVNPMYCRIISTAVAVGAEKPVSLLSLNVAEEREALDLLWQLIRIYTPLVGFNIIGFDSAVLLVRSIITESIPTRMLDRRKYGSRDFVDLQLELYPDFSRAMGLKPTCKALGIDIPAEGMDGGAVYLAWKEGRFDDICEYNESDVYICQQLHLKRLAGYFVA